MKTLLSFNEFEDQAILEREFKELLEITLRLEYELESVLEFQNNF